MKTNTTPMLVLTAALTVAGCKSSPPHDKGPYMPQPSKAPDLESVQPLVLLDGAVAYSVTGSVSSARTLEDGRLEVNVSLRNRETRRIEVQANCVFKDIGGTMTEETPFQTVILTENATEQVRFVSMNDKAKKFTVRVRQAH
jgi:hypothetical protein